MPFPRNIFEFRVSEMEFPAFCERFLAKSNDLIKSRFLRGPSLVGGPGQHTADRGCHKNHQRINDNTSIVARMLLILLKNTVKLKPRECQGDVGEM